MTSTSNTPPPSSEDPIPAAAKIAKKRKSRAEREAERKVKQEEKAASEAQSRAAIKETRAKRAAVLVALHETLTNSIKTKEEKESEELRREAEARETAAKEAKKKRAAAKRAAAKENVKVAHNTAAKAAHLEKLKGLATELKNQVTALKNSNRTKDGQKVDVETQRANRAKIKAAQKAAKKAARNVQAAILSERKLEKKAARAVANQLRAQERAEKAREALAPRRQAARALLDNMPYQGMMIQRAENAPIMPDNVEARWMASSDLIQRMPPDWAARIVCYPVTRSVKAADETGSVTTKNTSYAFIEILNQSPARKLIASYRVTRVRGVIVQRRHRQIGKAAWSEKVPAIEGKPHANRPVTVEEWMGLPESVRAVLTSICKVVHVEPPH